MNHIKWGVLSTANIAQKKLIPAIQQSHNGEVVAIASLSGKAKSVADELNIPKAYETYEALLEDPEINAVYIPLPNHLHKDWVVKAAEAGKHILCEKPAALNASEFKEMEAACQKSGVYFMEAFMYQFHPQHERVKEIMASGEIGDVKLMKGSFSFLLTGADYNIRLDAQKGGGSIYDIGCYPLHTFHNILDSEVDELDVHGVNSPKFNVDTSAYGRLKMQNGVTCLFDCSFDMTFRAEYEVVGTKGRIRVPRAYRPDAQGGEGLVIVEIGDVTREERIYGDQYTLEVEHFADVVLHGGELRNSYEDTRRILETIDRCYEVMGRN